MSNLTEALLAGVVAYGAPFLGLFLLLGALGVPLPTSLLVVAGGAFVRQGFLNPWQAMLLGLVGAVAGDSLSFHIGRYGEKWLERRFGTHPAWQRAAQAIERQGGLAVYFTRFLLTAIAVPVNLTAGAAGYPFRRFAMASIAGETTWIVLYGGLGYWFGSQWEAVSEFAGDFSGLILGVAAIAAAIYVYRRNRQKRK